MRIPVRIIQIFVGILFIISGLVKANDPVGLSYKMQEFFELWSEGFTQGSFLRDSLDFFHNTSLLLSVTMITLEILAGVALLIGWKKKAILWLLLVLIVFFTFLTGYAYLSGRFTNCGCFGDCLPITPLTSFIKDIVLLVMIVFLLAGQKYINPVFSGKIASAILVASLILSLGMQWYVLTYLPLADCLPFKKGNNIAEQMKPPAGSQPDSIVIKYIYEKEGKRYEWAATELPADFSSYKYIDRIDKVVRKGNAEPPIKGFSLLGVSGADSTQIVLDQEKAILVYALDFKDHQWIKEMKGLMSSAQSANIPLYVVSPNAWEGITAFGAEGLSTHFFNTDFTIVRTVARTNPTIIVLNKGTITHKYSKNGFSAAQASVQSTK
ncbi:MAG: DoxX family protein [Chitinophagaceae bacterium]|nr:MAG: DoxX family protein [Chitinophagaceae bacterium]